GARMVRSFAYMRSILTGESFASAAVSLTELAVETRADFSHLLAKHHMDLVLETAGLDGELIVQGHREMLRQVLLNLVANGIKYSPDETRIVIRERQEVAGPTLEVINEGFEIPAVVRERIFERGYRARAASQWIPHGTGLGLWLVRKILDLHGAQIDFTERRE